MGEERKSTGEHKTTDNTQVYPEHLSNIEDEVFC